jgi:hypothetical protein
LTAGASNAVPGAVLGGCARAEAVMVLANMTMSALESALDGGGDERRRRRSAACTATGWR